MNNQEKAKFIEMIILGHESGQSRDEISTELMMNGAPFSKLIKLFQESGVKFRRSLEDSWKMRIARYFRDEPNPTEKGMLKAIGDSVQNQDYYVKTYYEMMKIATQK